MPLFKRKPASAAFLAVWLTVQTAVGPASLYAQPDTLRPTELRQNDAGLEELTRVLQTDQPDSSASGLEEPTIDFSINGPEEETRFQELIDGVIAQHRALTSGQFDLPVARVPSSDPGPRNIFSEVKAIIGAVSSRSRIFYRYRGNSKRLKKLIFRWGRYQIGKRGPEKDVFYMRIPFAFASTAEDKFTRRGIINLFFKIVSMRFTHLDRTYTIPVYVDYDKVVIPDVPFSTEGQTDALFVLTALAAIATTPPHDPGDDDQEIPDTPTGGVSAERPRRRVAEFAAGLEEGWPDLKTHLSKLETQRRVISRKQTLEAITNAVLENRLSPDQVDELVQRIGGRLDDPNDATREKDPEVRRLMLRLLTHAGPVHPTVLERMRGLLADPNTDPRFLTEGLEGWSIAVGHGRLGLRRMPPPQAFLEFLQSILPLTNSSDRVLAEQAVAIVFSLLLKDSRGSTLAPDAQAVQEMLRRPSGLEILRKARASADRWGDLDGITLWHLQKILEALGEEVPIATAAAPNVPLRLLTGPELGQLQNQIVGRGHLPVEMYRALLSGQERRIVFINDDSQADFKFPVESRLVKDLLAVVKESGSRKVRLFLPLPGNLEGDLKQFLARGQITEALLKGLHWSYHSGDKPFPEGVERADQLPQPLEEDFLDWVDDLHNALKTVEEGGIGIALYGEEAGQDGEVAFDRKAENLQRLLADARYADQSIVVYSKLDAGERTNSRFSKVDLDRISTVTVDRLMSDRSLRIRLLASGSVKPGQIVSVLDHDVAYWERQKRDGLHNLVDLAPVVPSFGLWIKGTRLAPLPFESGWGQPHGEAWDFLVVRNPQDGGRSFVRSPEFPQPEKGSPPERPRRRPSRPSPTRSPSLVPAGTGLEEAVQITLTNGKQLALEVSKEAAEWIRTFFLESELTPDQLNQAVADMEAYLTPTDNEEDIEANQERLERLSQVFPRLIVHYGRLRAATQESITPEQFDAVLYESFFYYNAFEGTSQMLFRGSVVYREFLTYGLAWLLAMPDENYSSEFLDRLRNSIVLNLKSIQELRKAEEGGVSKVDQALFDLARQDGAGGDFARSYAKFGLIAQWVNRINEAKNDRSHAKRIIQDAQSGSSDLLLKQFAAILNGRAVASRAEQARREQTLTVQLKNLFIPPDQSTLPKGWAGPAADLREEFVNSGRQVAILAASSTELQAFKGTELSPARFFQIEWLNQLFENAQVKTFYWDTGSIEDYIGPLLSWLNQMSLPIAGEERNIDQLNGDLQSYYAAVYQKPNYDVPIREYLGVSDLAQRSGNPEPIVVTRLFRFLNALADLTRKGLRVQMGSFEEQTMGSSPAVVFVDSPYRYYGNNPERFFVIRQTVIRNIRPATTDSGEVKLGRLLNRAVVETTGQHGWGTPRSVAIPLTDSLRDFLIDVNRTNPFAGEDFWAVFTGNVSRWVVYSDWHWGDNDRKDDEEPIPTDDVEAPSSSPLITIGPETGLAGLEEARARDRAEQFILGLVPADRTLVPVVILGGLEEQNPSLSVLRRLGKKVPVVFADGMTPADVALRLVVDFDTHAAIIAGLEGEVPAFASALEAANISVQPVSSDPGRLLLTILAQMAGLEEQELLDQDVGGLLDNLVVLGRGA